MKDILKELHLESLIPHFLAERIEPANVAALSHPCPIHPN